MKHLLLIIPILIFSCKPSLVYENQDLHGDFIISEMDKNKDIPKELSIGFDSTQNRIYGFSGCNRYFGIFTQDKNKLTTNDLALSNKLCFENDIMNIESKLLELLQEVTHFELTDKELKLLNDDDSVVLVANPTTIDHAKGLTNHDFKLEYHTKTMLQDRTVTYENGQLICGEGEEASNQSLTDEKINQINMAVNKLNLEEISSYEAPSEQRHVDGAAYATLTIHKGTKSYMSKDFDHGNPPSQIEELVNLLTQENVCKD